MRSRFCSIVVLLLGALLTNAFGADEKPATAEKTAPAKKDAPPRPPALGMHFTAKLLRVEGSQRVLTVQVSQKVAQPNLQNTVNLANLQAQLATAIRNRDAAGIRSAQVQIAQNQAGMFRDDKQKLELEAPDDLKVRTLMQPVEYDEKGRPRKLTDKEKKELKGPDPTLPGFTADFDSLKQDQIVEIYLPKGKTLPKYAPKPKPKDGDAGPESSKLKPVMIVIQLEPLK